MGAALLGPHCAVAKSMSRTLVLHAESQRAWKLTGVVGFEVDELLHIVKFK